MAGTNWVEGHLAGQGVFLREKRAPWRPLTAPLYDYTDILVAQHQHPDAITVADDPASGVGLLAQLRLFRQDDKALLAIYHERPNTELSVYHAILTAGPVVPCFPADGAILGKCTCARGLTDPHPAGHPVLGSLATIPEVIPVFLQVPGLAWRMADLSPLPDCPWRLSAAASAAKWWLKERLWSPWHG